LRGKLVRELGVHSGIPDERIDILSHQVGEHGRLLSARHDGLCRSRRMEVIW
jgi:hypothetical protein